MKTERLNANDPRTLKRALAVLRTGGLVAFPTDTVYGVGADAFAGESIARIFQVKKRPAEKSIAILLGSSTDLPQVAANLPSRARRLADHFWPGPLTLVVWRKPELPAMLGPGRTVGVRVPDHPFAQKLLRAAGPLATSSANRSGGENNTTADGVFSHLGGQIELLIDGGSTPGGTPSTVVDCTDDELRILRSGPIAPEDLWAALD